MSTFTGLNTMVRGIYMNQLSLNTVGHNIVNAGTVGYSRQFAAPVATQPEHRAGITTGIEVGTGVAAMSLTRSRDTYADYQFRKESCTQSYYESMATSFDEIESIFNDATNTGVADAISEVWKAWSALSTEGPTPANRTTVVEKSKILSDVIQTTAAHLQDQINDEYDQLRTNVQHVDDMLGRMAEVNKAIVASEADGSSANDLRDQRDVIADDLAKYFNLSITENDLGAYQVVTDGCVLVNGFERLHLDFDEQGLSTSLFGADYGLNDHNINIRESNQVYVPYDAVEECKQQMDVLANMAAFMMTTLNDQHAAGYDMNGEFGRNFFGVTDYKYEYGYDPVKLCNYVNVTDDQGVTTQISGIKIINALNVNADFDQVGGYKFVAAATAYRDFDDNQEWITYTNKTDLDENKIAWGNRTGDGTNAVYISELFNMPYDTIVEKGRVNAAIIQKYTQKDKNGNDILDSEGNPKYITALGLNSINAYYDNAMTQIGVDAASIDTNIAQHDIIMTQIENWRDSVSGVDWNEELTDMIKYQKAYGSCARCLSAMDECLERLVNNTGMVGR